MASVVLIAAEYVGRGVDDDKTNAIVQRRVDHLLVGRGKLAGAVREAHHQVVLAEAGHPMSA